ncbi:hypothetical protein I2I11_07105 [Pontibacter sp. 172403-2]|uniref:hypothetical protein n=1 Tax=Pontibacter rufus TaxID=2791028 RepID=UPI0018AFC381|nr:hypothetical protein [Pontibacter sp. 172403-2]MBF9253054.1 hypothetical protein [Pontibacter sp. 172403-2]
MPSYKHTQGSSENEGNPSGRGQSKAGVKTVDPSQTGAEHEELKKKYTDGPDKPSANVKVEDPNRNLDKPELDNGKYN